jgi:hypothetical protein
VEAAVFRKFIFVFLALIFTACTTTGTSKPASTPSAGQIDTEEQAVYAAVLQSLYPAPAYVIMDTTATSPGGVGDTVATLDQMQQNMRGLDPKTADSFRVRNETAHLLQSDMSLGSPYVLLSQTQMNQLFSPNRDGWQAFYEQYPNAPGITDLSRAGFNDTLDQALVYVGTMSHYLAGAGYYVLLKKVNGIWKVDQKEMTWIS